MKTSPLLIILLSFTMSVQVGCVKKDEESSTSSNASPTTTTAMPPFRTNCGTVTNASLENPVDSKGGVKGTVTVTGGNLLVMKPETGGDILIKLHAIGVPYNDTNRSGAERIMRELAKESAIFFPASKLCTTTISGATATVGQLFTTSGKSYTEAILQQGYARVEGDGCDASLIYSCYSAIAEEAAQNYAGEVEALLWKPVSDSTGKLAVHASPGDTVIVVNGETGQDFSGGNGYANLARFSKPGCSYGKNVTVKVLNSKGVPYRANGNASITIPDGCQRYCLTNGSMTPCPKN